MDLFIEILSWICPINLIREVTWDLDGDGGLALVFVQFTELWTDSSVKPSGAIDKTSSNNVERVK